MSNLFSVSLGLLVSMFAMACCERKAAESTFVISNGEEVEFAVDNRCPGIVLLMPKGYRSEILEGYDFKVFYYHSPAGRGTIAFYLGNHPSYNNGFDSAEVLTRDFGDLSLTFRRITTDSGFYADALAEDYFVREEDRREDARMEREVSRAIGQEITLDERDLHIMITSHNLDYFAEAWAILKTARKKDDMKANKAEMVTPSKPSD